MVQVELGSTPSQSMRAMTEGMMASDHLCLRDHHSHRRSHSAAAGLLKAGTASPLPDKLKHSSATTTNSQSHSLVQQ